MSGVRIPKKELWDLTVKIDLLFMPLPMPKLTFDRVEVLQRTLCDRLKEEMHRSTDYIDIRRTLVEELEKLLSH